MADRSSRAGYFDSIHEFERVFDSLFDELLISRWRGVRSGTGTVVSDLGDHYEVKLERLIADPKQVDIEASERRLTVRSVGSDARSERVIDFRHPIDAEAVTAKIENGVLKIVLPKVRGRKIEVG